MKLTIENFQAHEKSTLEFKSPGINTITGRNSHGKSSIMRAARLVALGGGMDRRHGTKESSVDIDGCARLYKGGKNQHIVPGVKEPLKALRTGVPPQVSEKLRLTEVNFRDQHEAYFLLSDSPGARARTMNTLADLGVIDYVASSLKSEGRDLEAERKILDSDLEKAKTELAETDWAIQAEADLKLIEGGEQIIQDLTSQKIILQEMISQVISLNERLASFPPPSTMSLFIAANHAVDRDGVRQLQSYIADVLCRKEWLESLPTDMGPDLKSHQKRLNELPEISTLANLRDRLAEYQEDLRLCPVPGPDIAKLKAISFYPIPEELSRAVVAARAQVIELESYKGLGGWEGYAGQLRELESVVAVMVESTRTLSSPVSSCKILALQSTDLSKQCADARAELNAAFNEAGKCPLCGADCGGNHE